MVRRLSCSIVLALLTPFVFAQDLSKPIDYTAKAVPMRVIAEELSKQGGVKLKVDTPLEEEPLILRLNHVPLKEALDKIADVFAAEWVDHKDFLRLERSPEKAAKIRQALFNERLTEIKKSQERLRKSLDKASEMDAASADKFVKDLVEITRKRQAGSDTLDEAKEAELYGRMPYAWLTSCILCSMDPARLAAIQPGKRVVFCFHPNRVQEQLPSLNPEILARFERERGLVAKAFEQQVPQGERQPFWHLNTMTLFGAPVADVVVATVPVAHDDKLSLQLTYADSKGDFIFQDSGGLGWDGWSAKQTEYVKARQQALKDGFELSPLAKELAPRTLDRRQGEIRPLAKEALEFLLNPTRHEPLSLATTEIVLKAAELESANAVCLVPDAAEFYALNSARLGKTNLAALQAGVQRELRVTFAHENGWIVVKPDDPADAQEGRMPRELLEKFVQSAYKQGYVSLDTAADLLGAAPLTVSDDLADKYARYLIPQGGLFSMGAEPEMLRLLGKLSPEQRDTATRGTLTLRLRDLDDEQRAVVHNMLFNALNAMQQEDSSPQRGNNDHLKERTSFFSNGLPEETTLEVTDLSEPAVFAQETQVDGQRFTIAWPLSGLPQMLAQSEHPELFPGSTTKVEKLKNGARRLIKMRLAVGSRRASDELREEHPGGGEMVSLQDFVASLPADQRQKVMTEVALLLERQRKDMRVPVGESAGQGGGTKPPVR